MKNRRDSNCEKVGLDKAGGLSYIRFTSNQSTTRERGNQSGRIPHFAALIIYRSCVMRYTRSLQLRQSLYRGTNMNSERDIKGAIIKQYDDEAQELDTASWLARDDDVRVPEPGAAHYFVGRKVAMGLKLCGNRLSDSTRVLEIGCSFGQMTALLAKRFSHLTAVDISPKSVQIAEKRLRTYGLNHVHFAVDDAESLRSVSDNSFDVVFSFSTLRFCPQPEKALTAIKDKLRPDGIAIIDFPNRNSPWHLLMKPLLGIKPHIYDRLYTASEAMELFRKSGYTVEQVKCFLFTSRRLPVFLLPLFAVIDFVLERAPLLSKLAGIIMVKGVKK